tara:strand:+ start:772 stop:1140 length:369 start_codon:yes stop_codon:yes gene_type:complete
VAAQHGESTKIFREQTSKKTDESIASICTVMDVELGLKMIQQNELLRHAPAPAGPAPAPAASENALMEARDKQLRLRLPVHTLRPSSKNGTFGHPRAHGATIPPPSCVDRRAWQVWCASRQR